MLEPALLNQDQLSEWSGFQRKADIEHWLRINNIQFIRRRKNRICTTLAAVNASLYNEDNDEIEFI